jgi:hypothetical protein
MSVPKKFFTAILDGAKVLNFTKNLARMLCMAHKNMIWPLSRKIQYFRVY